MQPIHDTLRLIHASTIGLALAATALSALAADYDAGLDAAARGDLASAYREFSALAAEGHPAAQYSLAMLYLKSDPPQYTRAIPWLEASAKAALPDAQYMLGMLALYGVGMPKDTEQGLRWLTMASQQGNGDAKAELDALEQARLREAEAARRKAERARGERAELAEAEATERALAEGLAKSGNWGKRFASEEQSLRNARARGAETKARLQREQQRVEREAVVTSPTDDEFQGRAIVSGRVLKIFPHGVLLGGVSRRIEGSEQPFPDGFVVFLEIASTEGLTEGQQVIYPAEPAPPYRYELVSGATGRIHAYRVVGE